MRKLFVASSRGRGGRIINHSVTGDELQVQSAELIIEARCVHRKICHRGEFLPTERANALKSPSSLGLGTGLTPRLPRLSSWSGGRQRRLGRGKGRKSGGGWLDVSAGLSPTPSFPASRYLSVSICRSLRLPRSLRPPFLGAFTGFGGGAGGEVSSGCPRRLSVGQPAAAAGRWESRRRRDRDLAERLESWSNRPKRGWGESPCLCPEAYLRRRVGPRPGRLARAAEAHRAQKQRPAVPRRCSGCRSLPLPLLTPGGSPRCRSHAAVTFWSLCDARSQQGQVAPSGYLRWSPEVWKVL